MNKKTVVYRMNHVVKNLTPSGYKMGDLFRLVVTLDNGEVLETKHDTREWYSGRGKKWNSSIRHGDIQKVMTLKELNKAFKPIQERIDYWHFIEIKNKVELLCQKEF